MSKANTALITGASAGIGAVYADRLARRGHDLILVARDEARLNALAARLRAETGRSVDILTADLAVRADLLRVEHRLRQDPSIGMLVNNAGVAVAGPMHGFRRGPAGGDGEPQHHGSAPPGARRRRGLRGAWPGDADQCLVRACSGARAVQRGLQRDEGFHAEPQHGTATELANTGIRVQAVLPGATRTEIWGKAGVDIAAMPADKLMDVGEMVDAALAGLDIGEAVTIPSLPDIAEWSRFDDARLAMGPNLSLAHAARRYQEARRSGMSAATRPGQVLAIVCAGIVLANLDLFIVNVALPNIAQEFNDTNLGSLSWILNGYAIVYAALLVFCGRLAERFPRNASFLAGIALFTAASAACALANSVEILVAFRLVQAAGAALLTPTSLGLILATFPAERRGGAVSDLGRGRRLRRRSGTFGRRIARHGQLAVDFSGQRADWAARIGGGLDQAP